MVKANIRIPTAQYAYIEYQFEGTMDEVVRHHNLALKTYLESQKLPQVELSIGLDTKAWQKCLDRYMVEGVIEEEDLSAMSERQKLLIHEIKKSVSRIKNRTEN